MRSTFRNLAFALGIYLAVWIGTYLFFLITFRLGSEENEVANRLNFTFTNIFLHLIDAWTFGDSAGAIFVWFFSLVLFWPCLAVIWTLWSFRSSNLKTFTLRTILLRQLVPLWLVSTLGFGGFCLYFKVGSVQDFGLHLNAAVDSPVVWRDLVIGRIKLGDSGEKLRENYDLKRVEIVEGADLYESPRNGWFSGLYLMTSNDKIVWAGTGSDNFGDLIFFENIPVVEAIDQKFADRYEMAKRHIELLTSKLTEDHRFSEIQITPSRKAGNLFIRGVVYSDEDLMELQEIVKQSTPPFDINWSIEADQDTYLVNRRFREEAQTLEGLLSDYELELLQSEGVLHKVSVNGYVDTPEESARLQRLVESLDLTLEIQWNVSDKTTDEWKFREEMYRRLEERYGVTLKE